MLKRGFDIACSLLALIVLSPILLPIVLILALTGEHEIFYRQIRVGRGGVTFSVLKFATMLKNSASMPGADITMRNDPRVLPVGRFLRKTKINELPQLLNILFGDMSIIGPRPLTPRIYARFSEEHRRATSSIRPGLSGIGSLFFRNEEDLLHNAADRDDVYFNVIQPYKAALELWYVHNWSFWQDIKLIALTVIAVFRPNSLKLSDYFENLPPVPQTLTALMSPR